MINWDKLLSALYEDWLQSNEDWMQSSLYMRMNTSNSQKRRGKHVLLPYLEVKKKFGALIASNILTEKKHLEANKPKGDSTIYWMEHPEAKGNEETMLDNKETVLFPFNDIYIYIPLACVGCPFCPQGFLCLLSIQLHFPHALRIGNSLGCGMPCSSKRSTTKLWPWDWKPVVIWILHKPKLSCSQTGPSIKLYNQTFFICHLSHRIHVWYIC